MIAFLTSSPTGPYDGSHRTTELDKKNNFVENLKKYWKPNARCLMIASSPLSFDINDRMSAEFKDTLQKTELSVSLFDFWDARTENVSKATLHSYDVVILSGGHVPTQNEYFRRIHLRENIQDFEGVVIGISAGTMNSADIVYAQPELPGESVDSTYVRFLQGLGLTKTMIIPHYQAIKNLELDGKRLFEDITYGDSYGRRFVALPDSSYLMIEDNKETIWGEAYEIADGKISKIVR